MPHLSKNQKKILEILEVKPEMTTKEIAEMIYGRIIECKTKEYSFSLGGGANLQLRLRFPKAAYNLKESESDISEKFRRELETVESYAEVWRIVKNTAEFALNRRGGRIMLFLDDLPLQLGAYHPVGTNNIVLNRALVEIVEVQEKSKRVVNALIYNLLLHEYLHVMGEYSEAEVRRL